MIGDGLPIGRVCGISIKIHISWFIIFGLVIWTLATGFPAYWELTVRIAAAVIAGLLFFASVLLHELAHSVIARRNNIPVGAITLFVFGGVAQIAEEPREPGMEFRIAAAGPLISVVFGCALWGLSFLLPPGAEVIRAVVSWLGWINLVLGVFNLTPAFPMDGGRILRAAIWWRTHNLRRSTKIASLVGQGISWLFIIAGLYLFFFASYGFNGLWLAFIGWFLYGSASSGYQQLVLQQELQGHAAREIMTLDGVQAHSGMTVSELAGSVILPGDKRCFVVFDGACPQGLITMREIKAVPARDRAHRTVEQVMKPLDRLKTVSSDDNLAMVMRLLLERNVHQVLVVEQDRLVGMISQDSLLRFINLKGNAGA